MKQDYTKYSESSNNIEKEKLIEEQLKLMTDEPVTENNNDQHIVNPELEETVLKADGDVMRVDNTDPIQNNDPENVEPELPEVDEPDADEDRTGDICPAKINGCAKLNLRREPSKDSDVVCVITKKNTITVCRELSTEDFYKVHTTIGETLVEGYCMKQFIEIE